MFFGRVSLIVINIICVGCPMKNFSYLFLTILVLTAIPAISFEIKPEIEIPASLLLNVRNESDQVVSIAHTTSLGGVGQVFATLNPGRESGLLNIQPQDGYAAIVFLNQQGNAQFSLIFRQTRDNAIQINLVDKQTREVLQTINVTPAQIKKIYEARRAINKKFEGISISFAVVDVPGTNRLTVAIIGKR